MTAGLPPAPPKDIFARFTAAAAAQKLSLNDVFSKYDTGKKGWLAQDQVLKMVRDFVPSASDLDCSHFRAMMDLDGNAQVTLAEFLQCLSDNKAAAAAVRRCLARLHCKHNLCKTTFSLFSHLPARLPALWMHVCAEE